VFDGSNTTAQLLMGVKRFAALRSDSLSSSDFCRLICSALGHGFH
jgi:hypothetical protein